LRHFDPIAIQATPTLLGPRDGGWQKEGSSSLMAIRKGIGKEKEKELEKREAIWLAISYKLLLLADATCARWKRLLRKKHVQTDIHVCTWSSCSRTLDACRQKRYRGRQNDF
jgi:hypothetical protein